MGVYFKMVFKTKHLVKINQHLGTEEFLCTQNDKGETTKMLVTPAMARHLIQFFNDASFQEKVKYKMVATDYKLKG